MNRFRIGVFLLAALLLLGLGVQEMMARIQMPIAEDLERASASALSGNWGEARRLADRAEQAWQSHWCFTAAAADHQPMEDIDSLLAQLRVFGETESESDFPALCAELSRRILAMADAHRLNFANLF